MTVYYAFDGANPKFSLSAAKAAGGIAITVYIVGTPGGMPHADAARVAAIRAEGMGALPNWERAADFFSGCSLAQAQAAGAEALAACRSLGFPADGTVQVAFSFDFQVPTSRFAEMGSKVDAVQRGLTSKYIAMIYGQQDLIDYLVAHGHVHGGQWLMASTWGKPYNPADPNVCLVQSHDAHGNWIDSHVAGTDINTVTQPRALRAWWPDNSPYLQGDDMPLNDADVAKILHTDNIIPTPPFLGPDVVKANPFVSLQTMLSIILGEAHASHTLAVETKAELDALKAKVATLEPTAQLKGTADVTINLTP